MTWGVLTLLALHDLCAASLTFTTFNNLRHFGAKFNNNKHIYLQNYLFFEKMTDANYDASCLPDLLPIYYKKLFPYGPYFRWLNYGGGKHSAGTMLEFSLMYSWPFFIRLGKSLKPTIIASFSYNSFKRLANWSLEDMFFGNTLKSLRVAPPPFYNTHENIRLMSTVSYILSAPSRFWGRKHYFCRFYSIG